MCSSASPRSAARSTRPASRATALRSTTSTSVGTSSTPQLLARPRRCVDVDLDHAQASRSLRAMWATRLSIRRAGPEREDVKKTSSGWGSPFIEASWDSGDEGPHRNTRERPMCNLAAWATGTRSGSSPASAPRSGVAATGALRRALRAPPSRPSRAPCVGLVFGQWDEALGGALGGACGALGIGAARRAARCAAAARAAAPPHLLALAALVGAALAFVPVARVPRGHRGAGSRRTAPRRARRSATPGLRSLARD